MATFLCMGVLRSIRKYGDDSRARTLAWRTACRQVGDDGTGEGISFKVAGHGDNALGLAEICQRYVDQLT